MTRRSLLLIVFAVLVGGGLVAVHRDRSVAAAPRPTAAQLLDANIGFYEAVAARDRTGAMALGQLALLYMRRARATGDYQDVLRSESAARRSLANRAAHNARARQALAASLLSEHRFTDAIGEAEALAERDPTNAAFRASLGEIQMELGRYEEARASFAMVAGKTNDLSVAPRLARWIEINGDPDSAFKLMNASLLAIMQRRDVPAEQQAWFWLRIGDLQLRRGLAREAEYAYERGLAVHAEDYRLLAARAKLAGARHQWKDAIAFGQRAVAVSLDPATLGVMSDAYAALGDTAKAEEYAHAMEVAVSQQATAYHRAWSLFLLEHGRRVDQVLAKAQEELTSRRDIYGYDVVAWALHAKGRDEEARAMMTHALALGTRDAMLLYHASAIDRALGRGWIAQDELARARAIDPEIGRSGP